MLLFCETFKLKTLINKPTCSKKDANLQWRDIDKCSSHASKHISDRDRAIRTLSIGSEYYEKSV